MSGVRLLVGTRKGAFTLTADGTRRDWQVSGPHFGGWEIYHVNGSPADPDRLYASQSVGLVRADHPALRRRRPIVGAGRQRLRLRRARSASTSGTTARRARGSSSGSGTSSRPATDPDTVYAGAEDAALYRSTDGGQQVAGADRACAPTSRRRRWQPGAGGMCLHTIILDPVNPDRIFVAISAAGAFRTDDGGATWQPINRGLRSGQIPDEDAEVGHCVHRLAMHPSRPDVLFMQKHWDVMRTDDAGGSWREISGNLPTDFGFPIAVHAHEPETVYVVPITSDSEHYVPDGKLRVYRSRTGGDEWEPLTAGLPQANCYVNVLRDAMAVDTLDDVRHLLRHHRRPGLRLGRRRRHVDARSSATCRRCCRWKCRCCRDPGGAARRT